MTPSSKIYDYNKLCDEVKIDPKIRFAGVINERGRLVAGGTKDDKKTFENDKDNEVSFMELALRVRMRREFDNQLGKVRFTMSLRESAIAMSFPIKEDILYVIADPDANFGKLPLKIIRIIDKQKLG